MHGWRWVQRFRLPFGFKTSLTRSGMGVSWGIPGLRFGISPSNRKWISLGFPGLGLYFFRYLDNKRVYKNPNNAFISDDGEIIDDRDFLERANRNRSRFNQKEKKKKTSIRKWKNLK